MVGQKTLKLNLHHLIKSDSLARFCIITGPKGSGKKTLVDWIGSKFNELDTYDFIEVGSKIEDIRNAIEMAHHARGNVIFSIPDADNMSNAAKNAMLKLVEEPPNNARFIMTLENIDNTLDTIRSRAAVINMNPYSRQELQEYYDTKYQCADGEYRDMIFSLAEVPGEVDLLETMDGGGHADKFYQYVELTVDNIAKVQGANSFKLADAISVKDNDSGYDIKLFFKAFMNICLQRMTQNSPERAKYAAGVSITSKYLQQLGIRGVSKQMLLDAWILQIRKEWM